MSRSVRSATAGAFGGKSSSVVVGAARDLADRHGRPVRVLLSREDTVRLGPKRPPIAAGVRSDGTGVVRVARTEGIAEAIRSVAPGLVVEQVDVPGPPTSTAIRGAGWVEAAVLLAALEARRRSADGVDAHHAVVVSPAGAEAEASIGPDGVVRVQLRCGEVLDPVVLRSYVIGAAHMALGWVTSEGLAVDGDGTVGDLTVRSFGVLRSSDMPLVEVTLHDDDREPVNGSDAVFAAVAATVWSVQGWPTDWPTGRVLGPGGCATVRP